MHKKFLEKTRNEFNPQRTAANFSEFKPLENKRWNPKPNKTTRKQMGQPPGLRPTKAPQVPFRWVQAEISVVGPTVTALHGPKRAGIYLRILGKTKIREVERVYYLLMVAVAMACLALAWRQGDRRLVAALFVVMGASIGVADVVMHGVLGLYRYHPHLLGKMLPDDMLGVILAELLFVPGLASLLALLPARTRWGGAAGIVALVSALDWVLGRLDHYRRTGWPVAGTPIAFAIFYSGFVPWTVSLERNGYTRRNRAIIITASVTYLMVMMIKSTCFTMGLWNVAPAWLKASFPDRVLGVFLFFVLPMVAVAHAGAWMEWTGLPYYFLAVAAGFALYTVGLDLIGFWNQASFWSPVLHGLVLSAQLFAVHRLDCWLAGETVRV